MNQDNDCQFPQTQKIAQISFFRVSLLYYLIQQEFLIRLTQFVRQNNIIKVFQFANNLKNLSHQILTLFIIYSQYYNYMFFTILQASRPKFFQSNKQLKISKKSFIHQYYLFLIQQSLSQVNLMQKVENPSQVSKSYNIDISQFPSQMIYFLVFPYSFDRKHKQDVAHIDPFVLTFRDQSIKFTEILDRYLKMNPKEKRNPKMLTFTLPMGSIINNKMSVKNLKKQLRRDRIDGLNLFLTESFEQKGKKVEGTEFYDECGLMNFIRQESFDSSKQFFFHFLLPRSSYIITISMNPSNKVSQLFEKFVQYLTRNYAQAITPNKFSDVSQESIKQYILCDETKVSKILHKEQLSINQCKHFDNGDMIKVITHDKNLKFAKLIRSDFQITLISKEDNPNLKSKVLKIHYDQITDFTVSNLYSVFFLSSAEERTKFDLQTKQNRICLKVLEYILYPDDTLLKIDKGIQKVKTLGDFKLVAYFVTEKMIFYQNMVKIGSKIDFSLDHFNIPETPRNKLIRKECEYNSQKFLANRMKQLQLLTIQHHFKTPKQVLPIVVYSSQLQILNEQTKSNERLYSSLNYWLYSKNLLKLKIEELEHWCFKFSSVLFKHLSPIKTQKNTLYRGVTFLLQAKQRDKVTFKNFLSTSSQRKVAIQFAIQGQYEKKIKDPSKPLSPLVLYNITATSGKSIEYFSVYPEEKEYLFEPYSQFKLIRKIQQFFEAIDPQSGKMQKYLFTVYDLQEIQTPKIMPQTINNYILWVDDKIGESTLIYNQLISEFHYPTVLFQLRSTQDLATWIKERSMIINDQTKKMIMITNMVRPQNGKPNFYAGVDAINIINQAVVPNIPIALYVGNIKSAEKNMKEKGCNCPNVKLMNTIEQLTEYVSQKIGVKFKRKESEDMQIIVSRNKMNDNDGEQSSFCQIM